MNWYVLEMSSADYNSPYRKKKIIPRVKYAYWGCFKIIMIELEKADD